MKTIKAGKFIITTSDKNAEKIHEIQRKRLHQLVEKLEEESKEVPTMILTNPGIRDYTPTLIDLRENSHIFIPKRKKLKGYQKR